MDDGGIAGIVIALLAVILACCGIALYFLFKRKRGDFLLSNSINRGNSKAAYTNQAFRGSADKVNVLDYTEIPFTLAWPAGTENNAGARVGSFRVNNGSKGNMGEFNGGHKIMTTSSHRNEVPWDPSQSSNGEKSIIPEMIITEPTVLHEHMKEQDGSQQSIDTHDSSPHPVIRTRSSKFSIKGKLYVTSDFDGDYATIKSRESNANSDITQEDITSLEEDDKNATPETDVTNMDDSISMDMDDDYATLDSVTKKRSKNEAEDNDLTQKHVSVIQLSRVDSPADNENECEYATVLPRSLRGDKIVPPSDVLLTVDMDASSVMSFTVSQHPEIQHIDIT